MNIGTHEEIREALNAAPEAAWSELIEDLKQAEYAKLQTPDLLPVDLTQLHTRVILLGELEHFLLSARQTPTTKQS